MRHFTHLPLLKFLTVCYAGSCDKYYAWDSQGSFTCCISHKVLADISSCCMTHNSSADVSSITLAGPYSVLLPPGYNDFFWNEILQV